MSDPHPSPLRVAILTDAYPRRNADTEAPALREAVRRAAYAHAVTVIAPAYKGLRNHTIDGVLVHRFRYAVKAWEVLTHDEGAYVKMRRSPWLLGLALAYFIEGVIATFAVCLLRRIRVLHVHGAFPHALMALAPQLLLRVKVVCTCDGAEVTMARRVPFGAEALTFCLRRAHAVFATSTHAATRVADLSGVTPVVVPEGATVAGMPGLATPDPHGPMILFCGRLIARKGVGFLIDAMPAILSRHPGARLVITGEGDCKELWEKRVAAHMLGHAVRFAGFVPKPDLMRLYRECAVYVHPAIVDDRGMTEGLPVSIIEALANRKPVVATRVGGTSDLIINEETGLLVLPKSPKGISDAVCRLLADRQFAMRLAERGRKHVEEHFDFAHSSAVIHDTYARIAGRRPERRPRPRVSEPGAGKHAA